MHTVDMDESGTPEINLSVISKFLKFFTDKNSTEGLSGIEAEAEEPICLAYFSHTGEVIPHCGVIRSSEKKLLGQLTAIKESTGECGYTVHLLINNDDGKGRKTENITGVRAYFCDIDREIPGSELKVLLLKYKPQMVIRSSYNKDTTLGKYHFYWKCDVEISLARWQVVQRGIAALMQGDPMSQQVTKLMRIPGIPRKMKSSRDGVESIDMQGSEIGDGKWYTPEMLVYQSTKKSIEYKKVFPGVIKAALLAGKEAKLEKIQLAKSLSFSLLETFDSEFSFENVTEIGKKIVSGKRNESLFFLGKTVVVDGKGFIKSVLELITFLRAINRGISLEAGGPIPEAELKAVAKSAYKAGIKRLKAKSKRGVGGSVGVAPREETEIIESTVKVPLPGNILKEVPLKDALSRAEDGPKRSAKAPKIEGEEPELTDAIGKLSEENKWAPYSDLAIVDRVLKRFGDLLCRIAESGEILAFDDSRKVWNLQKQGDGTPILFDDFIGQILAGIIYSPQFKRLFGYNSKGVEDLEKLERERDKLRKIHFRKDILFAIFNSNKIVYRRRSEFDANAGVLFCANGLLDLFWGESGGESEGESGGAEKEISMPPSGPPGVLISPVSEGESGPLREAKATDYLLLRSPVAYDAEAKCPGWEKFIWEVFEKNEEISKSVEFFQEVFGYSLTGSVSQRHIFCHLGDGANGKSTALGALRFVLGEYGESLGPDSLQSRAGDKFERLGAKLKDHRVVIIDDVKSSAVWDESYVKNCTSDVIETRDYYGKTIVVPNRAKVHVCLNQMPLPESASKAYFRRLHILLYNNSFEEDAEKSAEIQEMIRREASGILNWAISGLRRLRKNHWRFTIPNDSLVETLSYQEETSLTDEMLKSIFEVCSEPHFNEELMLAVEERCRELRLENPHQCQSHFSRKLEKLFPGKRFQGRVDGCRARGFYIRPVKKGLLDSYS